MRKLLIGAAVLGGLSLAGCTTLADIVNAIVANAKLECSVAVNAADIGSALAGQDPNVVIVASIVHSICDQYKLAVKAPAAKEGAAAQQVIVSVNGKPVHVVGQ